MAQHKSAVKRIRQSERRRIRNKGNLSKINTLVKKVRSAKGKEEASRAYTAAVKYLDRMATQGVIHKNKAANEKSKLTRFVNKLK